jgi:DNA-binding LytR/AlgR family response regulator
MLCCGKNKYGILNSYFVVKRGFFMPIQIAICDDSIEDIRSLSEALYVYDDSFQIFSYTDGESLTGDCLENERLFDILFLDIYMPGLNGIETAGRIRASNKEVKIIFISSSNEHYPEAYDVFAFNYIIKPLKHEKLKGILDQAMNGIIKERQQQICLNYKGKTFRVFCRDILYIESRDKTICIHRTDRSIVHCYAKMDDILKKLPVESFIRCHQSFAVNILHIDEIMDNYFRISLDVINISKKYHKAAKEKYFSYLFTHLNRGILDEKSNKI